MQIAAVLFDAAGTLFTTRGSVGEIYGAVAREYGSNASTAAIQAAFERHFRGAGPLTTEDQKRWWKDIVHRVFTDVGMVHNFDRFFEQVYDNFRDFKGWILFPETTEVLTELRNRGFKLGIISNFDDRIYSVLESLRIRSFFDAITISSESGYCKPAPEIFDAAARALNEPASKILLVGDSAEDDVKAGIRAGLNAILLDRKASADSSGRIRSLRGILPLLPLPEGEGPPKLPS
jgi:putative hydrolase of the HAD superfamily